MVLWCLWIWMCYVKKDKAISNFAKKWKYSKNSSWLNDFILKRILFQFGFICSFLHFLLALLILSHIWRSENATKCSCLVFTYAFFFIEILNYGEEVCFRKGNIFERNFQFQTVQEKKRKFKKMYTHTLYKHIVGHT